MSNYLAIATVTATLQRTLQAAVQADVEGARVTTVRPNNLGNGTPETGVNLFLYQVTRNPALNNADATPFRSKGTPVRRQAALDLYYMLSFYGNDIELEPQRLLGSVIRTLNDRYALTTDMIRETILDSTFTFLSDSNLAEQIYQVSIVPEDLNLEDLSKAWSVFFQTPYLLSVVYKITVVAIEGEDSVQRALPVRDRNLGGMVPFPNQLVVEQVMSQAGRFVPIQADSVLLIRGRQLKNDRALVQIGGIQVTPSEITDTQILVPLAAVPSEFLRAGVQSLQVVHPIATGLGADANQPFRYVESNAFPFVLRPTVLEVTVSAMRGRGDDLRSATLTIQVNLPIGAKQRVVLSLNEWTITNPATYLFDTPARTVDMDSVAIAIRDVKPGEYLVRLQIDGAESQLEVDTEADSPTFNWYNGPRVLIQ